MNKFYDEEEKIIAKSIVDDKKGVFLLGDSIRMGYCEYTKKLLENIADVRFPEENCRFTQYTYIRLQVWKDLFEAREDVAAVYWNNGHWDVAHWDNDEDCLNSIEDYKKMLVRIYNKIKKYFPNAKIIFSTTFKTNPKGIVGINPRSDKEIKEYNEAAKSVLSPLGVDIDDVFEKFNYFSEDMFKDYCHLTDEGFEILGKHVAEVIKNAII